MEKQVKPKYWRDAMGRTNRSFKWILNLKKKKKGIQVEKHIPPRPWSK